MMLDTEMPGSVRRSCVSRLAEEVVRTLNQAQGTTPSLSCHVLLDPALWSPLEDASFGPVISSLHEELTPITWSHPALLAEHRPLLLPLDLSRNAGSTALSAVIDMALEDLDTESLQQGQGQRVCGILLSECGVEKLAVHLGRIAIQTLPSKGLPSFAGKRRLLRFFDPLVTPTLWRLSSSWQQAEFLGPVSTWMSLGLDGNWQLWCHPQALPEQQGAEPPIPSALWNSQQWQTLLALSAFNPAALELGISTDAIQLKPRVLASLCRLMCSDVHSASDLRSMARIALTTHPEFDQHPMVRRCLAQRAEGQHAAQILSGLSADDWLAIQQDLRSE